MTTYADYPTVDQPTQHVGPPPGLTIEEAFEAFHAANPHVYHALVSMAWQAKDRGIRRVGIGMMFEVLRWNHALRTGGDEFKLNNNYRSYYARRIMLDDPRLEGLFETRALHFHTPVVLDPPCEDDDPL
jgi:hypothetical protein